MEAGQSSQHKNGNDEEEINVYLKVTKTVAYTVKKSEIVRNVKAMLNDNEGISASLQELFFNGVRLPDDQKLVDWGILPNSMLQLFVRNSVPIRLFIQMPSYQRTIVFEARTWDTIQNIKSFVAANEGIHVGNISVIYDGKLLEDEKTIASLNIQGESTVHMVIVSRDLMPISVKMPSGELLKIEVEMLYTIDNVKTIVETVVGFPLNDRSITYDGMQLENSKTISCYSITEGSILEISSRLVQVFVKNLYGKTITVDVCLEELVENVKDKIFRKLQLPADVQRLVFEGKVLENSRNLASYNIQMHSTIHLTTWKSSLQRLIKLSKIGISSRDLPSSMTISELKTMIQTKSRLRVKSLFIDGNMLLEGLSIAHYGIKKRTVVVAAWERK